MHNRGIYWIRKSSHTWHVLSLKISVIYVCFLIHQCWCGWPICFKCKNTLIYANERVSLLKKNKTPATPATIMKWKTQTRITTTTTINDTNQNNNHHHQKNHTHNTTTTKIIKKTTKTKTIVTTIIINDNTHTATSTTEITLKTVATSSKTRILINNNHNSLRASGCVLQSIV